MAAIKAIDKRTIHQIQSGQVIVDLCSVVKELVENSIDAGATTIDVRVKNQGLDLIEVQDNGSGISAVNYASLALKHHTSKLSSYSDIASLRTFGFRGEALASLCTLAHLTITTCVEADAPRASRLTFEPGGQLASSTFVAAQRGTTVSVQRLFHNLPVRRRELERNIKREWYKAVALLSQYACIQTCLKFSVYQQPSKGKRLLLFSTRGNAAMRDNMINIFGARALSNLVPLDLILELRPSSTSPRLWTETLSAHVRVAGYISRPTSGNGRQAPDRQMFYINGRPCHLPQLARIFNDVYRCYNCSQSPFILANVQLDPSMYDLNVSPDKRTILLHDQGRLIDSLRAALNQLFEDQDQVIPASLLVNDDRASPVHTGMQCPMNQVQSCQNQSSNGSSSSVDPILDGAEDLDPDSNSNTSTLNRGDDSSSKSPSTTAIGIRRSFNPNPVPPKSSPHADRQNHPTSLPVTASVSIPSRKQSFASVSESLQEQLDGSNTGCSLEVNSDTSNSNKVETHERNAPTREAQPGSYNMDGETVEGSTISRSAVIQDSSGVDGVNALDTIDAWRSQKSSASRQQDKRPALQVMAMLRIDENAVSTLTGHYFKYRCLGGSVPLKAVGVQDVGCADAEKKLALIISKGDFCKMRIVGQFNLGFIIAVRPAVSQGCESLGFNELFIIDQHASDEKFNFEKLQRTSALQSQQLVHPKRLHLTALEEEVVVESLDAIEANGFKVAVDATGIAPVGSRCHITALPLSHETTLGMEDFQELIALLGDQAAESHHIPRPSKVRKMFASRACRSSIMIGKALTISQMRLLVRHMSGLDKPWNCPHGRPTMRHLYRLESWGRQRWGRDTVSSPLSVWRSYAISE